ncbi:hypothetical protein FRC01_006428, partial [Tulasnella sp. 417]
ASKRKRDEEIDEEHEPGHRTSPKPAKRSHRAAIPAHRQELHAIQFPEHIRRWETGKNDAVLGTMPPYGKVAIKRLQFSSTMDEKVFSEGFSSEADLAASLVHPNLQSPIKFMEDSQTGIYWIVSPWQSNGNVLEFLASGAWNVSRRISLVQGFVAGIKYLHTHEPPICHGRLTPDNARANFNARHYGYLSKGGRCFRSAESISGWTTDKLKFTRRPTSVEGPGDPFRGTTRLAKRYLECWTDFLPGPELDRYPKPPFYEDGVQGLDPLKIAEWDLAGVASEEEKSQVMKFRAFTEKCCVTDPTKRLNAEQCGNEVNMVVSVLVQLRFEAHDYETQLSTALPSNEPPPPCAKTRSGALLCDEGRIKYQQNELQIAQSLFEEALEVARHVNETPVILEALAGLGNVFTYAGNSTRAIECLGEARKMHSERGNDRGVADSFYGLGEVYRLQGEYGKAEDAFINAEGLYSRIKEKSSLADTVYWLGEVYRVQKKLQKAQKSFFRAQRIYSTTFNMPGVAKASYWLGIVYHNQSLNNEALQSFEEARDAYMQTSNNCGMADASYWLGIVHQAQGNFEQADEAFLLAKTEGSQSNYDRNRANTLHQLAEARISRSEYDEAEQALRDASKIFARLGDKEGSERTTLSMNKIIIARVGLLSSSDDSSSSGDRNSSGGNLVEQVARLKLAMARLEPPVATAQRDPHEPDSPHVRDLEDRVGYIALNPSAVCGGFCDVFQGWLTTGETVALKRPRNRGNIDEIRRFEREATTWCQLRHSHVLEFIGTLKRDGHFYLVSRYMINKSLTDYLENNQSVNKVKLLRETADGIRYLHEMNIIHGDIKGGNILIDHPERAVICDFGLSRMNDANTSMGLKGAGSSFWMSPEVWLGQSRTFKSDVYSFGMTIVEVLTGTPPFSHLAHAALMIAITVTHERPQKEPMSSTEGRSYKIIWNIAERCWSKDAPDRIPMNVAFKLLCDDPAAY